MRPPPPGYISNNVFSGQMTRPPVPGDPMYPLEGERRNSIGSLSSLPAYSEAVMDGGVALEGGLVLDPDGPIPMVVAISGSQEQGHLMATSGQALHGQPPPTYEQAVACCEDRHNQQQITIENQDDLVINGVGHCPQEKDSPAKMIV